METVLGIKEFRLTIKHLQFCRGLYRRAGCGEFPVLQEMGSKRGQVYPEKKGLNRQKSWDGDVRDGRFTRHLLGLFEGEKKGSTMRVLGTLFSDKSMCKIWTVFPLLFELFFLHFLVTCECRSQASGDTLCDAKKTLSRSSGWWYGTFFIFHNIWIVILPI